MERLIHFSAIIVLTGMGVIKVYASELYLDGIPYESLREYLLHMAVGMFSGWAFYSGLTSVFIKKSMSENINLTLIALIFPILFLILIHQTRNSIDDGPATLAMAVGYFISLIYSLVIRKKTEKLT